MRSSPLTALVTRDVRTIVRDPFLFFFLFYGALLALVARGIGPYIPVVHIELYLAPAVVILSSMLAGVVLGLALVDEREQQTWLLFRVLPAGTTIFSMYLITSTVLVSLVGGALSALVYGRAIHDPAAFIGGWIAAACGAPFFLLLLGAYASNKVEALALQKIAGSITMPPVLIFFLPEGWQWVLWWNPWYWIYLGLLRGYASVETLATFGVPLPGVPGWAYGVIPITLCAAVCARLTRRYRRLVQ